MISKKMSSAAVVIGALRVKICCQEMRFSLYKANIQRYYLEMSISLILSY